MKWLGQYIQSFTARFRNDVYLENLSTTTETSALVVGSDGKISKNVTSGVNLANGADNRVVTAVGTNGLNGEQNLTFDGQTLSVQATMNTTANGLFIGTGSLTTGSAIKIDVNDALTAAASKVLLDIDYDKVGDTESGQASVTKGVVIDLKDTATDNVGTITMIGSQVLIDSADADGAVTQYGYQAFLTDGDVADTVGFYSNVENGGFDLQMINSADTTEWGTIAVGAGGAMNIVTTSDDATGHIELVADGNILLDPQNATNGIIMDTSANTTTDGVVIDCDSLTTGAALSLNVDDALTTAATKNLMLIDYDKTGVVDGAVHSTVGMRIEMNDTATNESDASVTMTGASIIVDSANAQGTIRQSGLYLDVASDGVGDAAVTTGIMTNVMDGGKEIKMLSSADTRDYATLSVTTAGATTLETVGHTGGGAAAHLALVADGNVDIDGLTITLDAATAIELEQDTAVTGDLDVSGSIRGKQIQIITANFKDNQGTTETWIPLSGQPEEKTGFANEQVLLLMPTSGAVKEIIVRAHYNAYTDEEIVFKVYTRASNKRVNGSSQIGGDITIDAPTQTDNTATNTRSTGEITHAYAAGDVLGISMTHQSTGPVNTSDRTYVTVVVENNLNDLSY